MSAKLPGMITPRTGSRSLYFRRSIPKAAREHFGCSEVWRSLRTADRREAMTRAVGVAQELQREIDRALRVISRAEPLRNTDIPHLAQLYYRAHLEQYESERNEGATPSGLTALGGDLSDPRAFEKAALEHRDWRQTERDGAIEDFVRREHLRVHADAKRFAEAAGKHVQTDSSEFAALCDAFLRAYREAMERTLERDGGDYSGAPRDPILLAEPAPAKTSGAAQEGRVTLGELFERYAAANPMRIHDRTLDSYRDIVRLFREHVGESAGASAMTKANVREWRNKLDLWPTKAAQRSQFAGLTFPQIVDANRLAGLPAITKMTVKKYLSALGGFSRWLDSEGYIEANPVRGLYPRVHEVLNPRHPFTPEELQTLVATLREVGSALGDEPLRPDRHRERVWAPLIAMFTGARLTEILQLRPTDVREEDGIWFFDITESDDASARVKNRLKNRHSRRRVPLHSTLLELGVLSIISDAKKARAPRVFADVVVDASNSLGNHFSRWFNRLLQKKGFRRGVVFHSLRHTVVDALRRAGHKDVNIALIVGHSRDATSNVMTNQYGELQEGTLGQRKEIVEAIAYPSLSLSPLTQSV